MNYLLIIAISIILSVILTILVRKLAMKLKIIDIPDRTRHLHKKPTPLLGGLAIFLAYFILLAVFNKQLVAYNLDLSHWLGFFVGSVFLMIGGFLDDRYRLKPIYQIIWPILAVVSVVLGGVQIEKITNPMGGFIYLGFFSHILIFTWLMITMYTTKLLDGIGGLVSGMTAIGGIIIFLFTITTKYYQPDIALAAAILAGVCLGFLIFNFEPAKIFLGEGGSLFLGFALGVLAIISGGKIAIALLIMGIPVLDLIWTIIRRLIQRKNPFKSSDRNHLHFRMQDSGLGSTKTVLLFYVFSATFGLSGLFLQSSGKMIALFVMLAMMIVIITTFIYLDRKPKREKLLLHICCAGCGAYIGSQVLNKEFRVTLYYANSNILSLDEYEKRLKDVRMISSRFKLPLIIEKYDHVDWLGRVKGREKDPERGPRCSICFTYRLDQTARKAKELGFKYFTTTLSNSPYKDALVINALGENIGKQYGVNFLSRDFKKNSGCLKSNEFCKDLNLYRQNYCGCEFSVRD